MKRTTGLCSLGLLLTAVALTVSCSDDAGTTNNTGGTGGSSAGTSSGGNNAAGTNNNTAGTNNNTAGTNNGGTNNPPQGGDGPGPGPQGGDGPGNIEECAANVEDGGDCDNDDACTTDDGVCFCGQNDEWNCQGLGAGGGPGGGFGDADCGATPMMGGDCEGTGICDGSEMCACIGGNVICDQ